MRKTMKIMTSIMTTIIMLFMAVPSVFADETTNFSVILNANKTSVKRGETVEVTIELGEFSNIVDGINSFMGDLEYDKTKLSIESGQIVAQNGWDTPDYYDNGRLFTSKDSIITANEEIIKITFTVNADAELGTTIITVKNAEAANDENDFVGIEGTVNIEIVEDSTGGGGTGDEECDHTYEIKHNDTEHWSVCSKCEEESGIREAHTYTYTDNSNGTHTATCTVCGYKTTEEHDFNNGTCTDCNAVQSTDDECEHTYEHGHNETQHWEACTKCGQIKLDTKKTHTYDSYTNNNDGTHTAKCSECGYEKVESHSTSTACDKCGYKPSSNNNNGGNSNNGNNNSSNGNSSNNDNTVADKEIPKAGLNAMIIFGIVAILGVAIIMYRKNQKYQDIK